MKSTEIRILSSRPYDVAIAPACWTGWERGPLPSSQVAGLPWSATAS